LGGSSVTRMVPVAIDSPGRVRLSAFVTLFDS